MDDRSAQQRERAADNGPPPARGARGRFRPTAELELRIAGGPEAAGAARRALTGLERHVRQPLLEDVKLLVSELVSNSIRHGGVGPAAKLELSASVSTETVRVEVRDPGEGFEPAAPALPEDGENGGFGLYLVEVLADRWGVERGAGTSVWFEVNRSASVRRAALAG